MLVKELSVDQMQKCLIFVANEIIDAEPYLTEIDTVIGDGDHGTGMKIGFTALKKNLLESCYNTIYELLHSSGLCLVRTMGGASGVLFGTLLIGGLEDLTDNTTMNSKDIITFFEKSTKSVQKRGRTKEGEKTMVDALLPAIKNMKSNITEESSVQDILNFAYKGALHGVEKTKHMLPRKGRSKNFKEQALGYPDPGAISVSLFFKGLYHGILYVEENK